eukprot:6182754-Pleurochrysis_carterae.AAC.3
MATAPAGIASCGGGARCAENTQLVPSANPKQETGRLHNTNKRYSIRSEIQLRMTNRFSSLDLTRRSATVATTWFVGLYVTIAMGA